MSPEDFGKEFNVPPETLEKFHIYYDILVKWQKAINLVSAKSLENCWERHFADSARLAHYIDQGAQIADLGSGAGFPGMVLAILRPDLKMHLIESDGRKCEFLKAASRGTDIPVIIHNARVENILKNLNPDIITARAFAPLKEILEVILWPEKEVPLLLLKGKNIDEEMAQARQFFRFQAELIPTNEEGGYIVKVKSEKD